MTRVESSWLRIVDWCQENAPRTAAALVPPVDDALLTQFQRETVLDWPEQLLAWLRLRDGGPICDPEGRVLPGYDPLGAAAIVDGFRMFSRLMSNERSQLDWAKDSREPAGTPPHGYFPPSSLPIAADGSGCYLLLDLRPGPLRGCVMELDHDEGVLGGPLWSGVEDMLTDVAESLQTGRPIRFPEDFFKLAYIPVVDQGALQWDFAD